MRILNIANTSIPNCLNRRRSAEVRPEENLDEKYAGRVPKDDVWIRDYYPVPRYVKMQKHGPQHQT